MKFLQKCSLLSPGHESLRKYYSAFSAGRKETKNDAGERLLSAWLTLSSTLWNERIVTGMTFNEAFVCNLLSRQDAAQPLTASDLCQRTKLLKSQMNKVLSEMERKGYIQRIRSEKDKRQVLLHLTEAGQAAYAK